MLNPFLRFAKIILLSLFGGDEDEKFTRATASRSTGDPCTQTEGMLFTSAARVTWNCVLCFAYGTSPTTQHHLKLPSVG